MYLVVIKEGGFLTLVKKEEKKETDEVLFCGSENECMCVIHGGDVNK